MSRVLGLDLGSNSIGWALVDNDKKEIIDSGVRIFQEGIDRAKGPEVSRNKDRRDARGARRRNKRYRLRRDKLKNSLKNIGMFPQDVADEPAFFKLNPYELRKKGLDEKLTLLEFGRALFHLNQRRGFQSNRKTASSEDGKIFTGDDTKTGIDDGKEALQKQYRTIGEYLADLNPLEKRQRNRYTLRAWYKTEFELLWQKQRTYYPDLLTEKEKRHIFNVIFFQRELKSAKHLVGYCTFEKKKRCSPKSSPVFQYYRILEQINRIRISDERRDNEPLNDEERKILVSHLMVNKELKFPKLFTLLKLDEAAGINLDTEKILGNNTYTELKKVFKDDFSKFTDEQLYQIWHTLHFNNDDEWLKKYARDKWGLDDEGIDRLLKCKIESKPNDGYARLSHKAMKKIMPELENGLRYDEAALQAGYHHSQTEVPEEIKQFLGEPKNIRNPIVQQTLYQLKKVVNALIQEYGNPDLIRVELARELKMNKKKREEMRRNNFQRQTEHEAIRKRLEEEYNMPRPSFDAVLRYKLWEECNGIDPYSGDHIGVTDLFSGRYEIEHIIPYSRSMDDSYMNKTLCRRDYNQSKGRQTPYEAFGGTDEFEFMVQRVFQFKDKRSAFIKRRKFLLKDVDQELSEDFIERQLNDTAYISRESRTYLSSICREVQVVKGAATAKLRYLWGMNSILSNDIDIKAREDHRHHAVDALAIANITPFMLHKLSTYHKYNMADKELLSENDFPAPWESFREDAVKSINNILVSFHMRNRARGKLHEETNYGQITDPETGEKAYVVRKKLDASLSPKMIGNIVNKETRQLVFIRLEELGVDITAKKWNVPKNAFDEPVIHPRTGFPIKSIRVKIPTANMIQLYKNRKLFVEPGSNHHIEIFENKDGKREGYIVSLYEAVQRKKKSEPVIRKAPYDENYNQFCFSLNTNEMFLIDTDVEDLELLTWNDISLNLCRIQKMDINKNIILRHHTVSLSGESDPGVIRKKPNTLKGIKVEINPIGRIKPVDD